jgi:serine/threonine protein kinase
MQRNHEDLKPSNVLINSAGAAKISDFVSGCLPAFSYSPLTQVQLPLQFLLFASSALLCLLEGLSSIAQF